MSYVVDASVAIKWFIEEELHEQALSLFDQPDALVAPDLICMEIANVAWEKAKRREISNAQAEFMEAAIKTCTNAIYPSSWFTEHALKIALQVNHKVYDCVYIACAKAINATVISADRKLCQIVKSTIFSHLVQHLSETRFDTEFG